MKKIIKKDLSLTALHCLNNTWKQCLELEWSPPESEDAEANNNEQETAQVVELTGETSELEILDH